LYVADISTLKSLSKICILLLKVEYCVAVNAVACSLEELSCTLKKSKILLLRKSIYQLKIITIIPFTFYSYEVYSCE
jgi:hypothetical protein